MGGVRGAGDVKVERERGLSVSDTVELPTLYALFAGRRPAMQGGDVERLTG